MKTISEKPMISNFATFDWLFSAVSDITTRYRNSTPKAQTFSLPTNVELPLVRVDRHILERNFDMNPAMFMAYMNHALSSDDTAIVQKLKELILLVKLKDDNSIPYIEDIKKKVSQYETNFFNTQRSIEEDKERVQLEKARADLIYAKESNELKSSVAHLITTAFENKADGKPKVWDLLLIEQLEDDLFLYGSNEPYTVEDVLEKVSNWNIVTYQSFFRDVIGQHKRWFLKQVSQLTNEILKEETAEDVVLLAPDMFADTSYLKLYKSKALQEASLAKAKYEVIKRHAEGQDGYDELHDLYGLTLYDIEYELENYSNDDIF